LPQVGRFGKPRGKGHARLFTRFVEVDEIERIFFDYIARGVPYGPDDGTVAPWSVVASLPFAPEIVLPTIKKLNALELQAAILVGPHPQPGFDMVDLATGGQDLLVEPYATELEPLE
jgi:hypothetical protein